MNNKMRRIFVPAMSFVTMVALACTCAGSGGDVTPTLPPVDPPTEAAPPTKPPIVAPTEPPASPTPARFTGGFDDFSTDYGGWEVFDGATIADGLFFLGQFNDCADVGSDKPFGCLARCLVCGYVSEYDMQVDAAYVNGVTDRTFGMILRFVDVDDDGLVDSEDYYIDFELSIYDQYFVVWEYLPGSGWSRIVRSFEGSIRGGTKVNTMRAVSYNGGTDIDIYINGNLVNGVTGVPYTEGYVGFVVGGRALQVAYDNFDITIP